MTARIASAAALLFSICTAASAQQSARDRNWIAHCISQISETNRPRAHRYCACMAEAIDTSGRLRQTDIERSYPPVHRDCFEKAGFKIPS